MEEEEGLVMRKTRIGKRQVANRIRNSKERVERQLTPVNSKLTVRVFEFLCAAPTYIYTF